MIFDNGLDVELEILEMGLTVSTEPPLVMFAAFKVENADSVGDKQIEILGDVGPIKHKKV